MARKASSIANRIMGACIILMMEQYKKRKGFTIEGVLFTKEEIITWANEKFPMRADVKASDMKPSSLESNCLQLGSEDSLREYYRFRYPENDFEGLKDTLEKQEITSIIYPYLPNRFESIEEFLDEYFLFIENWEQPPQESTIADSRTAIWIASATLTYNEYIRRKSTNLLRYAFEVSAISDLTALYATNPSNSGYSTNIKNCTKDSSRPISPFLINVDGKRRMALFSEVGNTRPENLPLDFKVNTIAGIATVQELMDFMNNTYNFFENNIEDFGVDVTEPSQDESVNKYGRRDFLREVYMSTADYEKLDALIRRKQNIVLQGAPGVGKSFCAKKLAYSMMGEKTEKRVQTVQFHQGYSYEDFVEGYRPNKTGYSLEKGIFYNFCMKADADKEHDYFFIIDEMNHGNLSKIFGELFTLLEKGKRGEEIKLVYSGESFTVPKNVYIIGLMNTADRSLAMIDYALRRRFGFFTMRPGFDTDGFQQYMSEFAGVHFHKLINEIKELNKAITNDSALGEGFCIGHSFFCELDSNNTAEEIKADLESIVENEIIPLLEEYWFDERENIKMWNERLRSALG